MAAAKFVVSRFLLLFTIVGVFGCSGNQSRKAQILLDEVAHAPEAELPKFIYGYDKSSPGNAKGSPEFVAASARSFTSAKYEGGSSPAIRPLYDDRRACAMATFASRGIASGPCHGRSGKEQVVGILLPFDDLRPLIQDMDTHAIDELSMWWITNYARRVR